MSEDDQWSGGTCLLRVLTRAVVFTGTTVAGTSVAWLLGAGIAAADSSAPPDGSDCASREASAHESVDSECIRASDADRSRDAAMFGLADLDSATLLASESTTGTEPGDCGALTTVTGAVREVLHSTDPILTPVQRAADEVLPGKDGRRPLPETIDQGLDALEQPLFPEPSEPPSKDRNPPSVPTDGDGDGDESSVTLPSRAPGAEPSADLAPPAASADTHVAAAGNRAMPHTTSTKPTSESNSVPAAPHGTESSPLLPSHAVVPGMTGCGSATDGHSNSIFGIGRQDDLRPPARVAGIAPGHGMSAPMNGTRPQPGTTPD